MGQICLILRLSTIPTIAAVVDLRRGLTIPRLP